MCCQTRFNFRTEQIMIHGFEIQTQPLSPYEETVLTPIIARGLANKIGKIRAITNKEICTAMKRAGYKIDNARLRKIINYIRVNGLVANIIATSDGYYIAESREELVEYLKSLEHREGAIHAVRVSLAKQMLLL